MNIILPNSPVKLNVTFRQPLLRIETVQSLLNLNHKEVVSLIEEGSLGFAFDIGSHPAGNKRCIRILTRSVAEYLERMESGKKMTVQEQVKASLAMEAQLPSVIQTILPAMKIHIPGTALAFVFACDPWHIGALIRDGSLKQIGRRTIAKETAKVCRESAIQFLKSRRV